MVTIICNIVYPFSFIVYKMFCLLNSLIFLNARSNLDGLSPNVEEWFAQPWDVVTLMG